MSVSETWVRGDWMQMFSGAQFYPLDPRMTDIEGSDIAHALSLLCRYGGHVQRFYSVAEHSVLMSLAVSAENALAALLHDATEAYVQDVVRPVKRYCPDYQAIEGRVWLAIAERFGLPDVLPSEVKEADNRILLDERAILMPNTRYSWAIEELVPLAVDVQGWQPALAEERFLRRLRELVGAS